MSISENWKKWTLYLGLILIGILLNELYWFTEELGFKDTLYRYQTIITGLFALLTGVAVIIAAQIQRKTAIDKHGAELKINLSKSVNIMLGKTINRQKQIEWFCKKDNLRSWLTTKNNNGYVHILPTAISFKGYDISILPGNMISAIIDSNDKIKALRTILNDRGEEFSDSWDIQTNIPDETIGNWLLKTINMLNCQLLLNINMLYILEKSDIPKEVKVKLEKAMDKQALTL